MVRWTIAPASGDALGGVPRAFVAKQDSEAMKVASGRRGPQSLRSAGLGCAIRGVLLFGSFFLDKQEKVALGAGRSIPHSKVHPCTAREIMGASRIQIRAAPGRSTRGGGRSQFT